MTIGERVQEKLQQPMQLDEFWKWMKFVLVIFAFGSAWAQLNLKLDAQTAVMREATVRGERMERYLSSRDTNYWQTVKQLE